MKLRKATTASTPDEIVQTSARSVTSRGANRPIRPERSRSGRIQTKIRRCLIFEGRLTTGELAHRIYCPPIKDWHVKQVREAARKFAAEVDRRRTRGTPILWALARP
jgi:hypothetical protein